MNKNPQTLDELVELIKDKSFKPTCEELSKLIDKVTEHESQNGKTKPKIKRKQNKR